MSRVKPGVVLCVDDEEQIRVVVARALYADGHTVLTAPDAETAMLALSQNPVDVIITDQHMPRVSGIDLLKMVRVRYPRVVRIMLTGDTNPETPVRSINEGEVYRFIRKPWSNADLRTIVSLACEVAKLEQEKKYLITLLRNQLASPRDPAEVEAEILLLAEEELEGRD